MDRKGYKGLKRCASTLSVGSASGGDPVKEPVEEIGAVTSPVEEIGAVTSPVEEPDTLVANEEPDTLVANEEPDTLDDDADAIESMNEVETELDVLITTILPWPSIIDKSDKKYEKYLNGVIADVNELMVRATILKTDITNMRRSPEVAWLTPTAATNVLGDLLKLYRMLDPFIVQLSDPSRRVLKRNSSGDVD